MGEKETPFNLFSSSGNKKPSKKEGEKAPARPQLTSTQKKDPVPALDSDSVEALGKIQEMQDDLKGKIDDIARRSGLSREDILKIIQTKTGGKAELEKMDMDLKAFAEKVWNAVGINETIPPKSIVLTDKERKTKTVAARRNWMRMP